MTVIDIKDRVKDNKLNLSGLNITKIPVKEIAPLNVSHLDLSNNKITSTENVFPLLPSLVKLDLSHNRIKSIAGDIGSLKKLTHLSLNNNRIKDLPKGLSKLKNLRHLNLSHNPLKSGVLETVEPSQNDAHFQSPAVNNVQYLKDNMDDSKKQDNKKKKKIKANVVESDKSANPIGKKPAGFRSKGFGFFGMLISYTLFFAVLSGLFLYALSYYDKNAYGNVKAKILPIWASATSNLDPKLASEVNYYVQQAGYSFDLAVQNSIKVSVKPYNWVRKNPNVQQYFKYLEDSWKYLWDIIFKKVKSV